MINMALGNTALKAVFKVRRDPRAMWMTLMSRYANHSSGSQVRMYDKLVSRKMKRGEDVRNFISDMETMFGELDSMGEAMPETIRVSMLLSNLGKEY